MHVVLLFQHRIVSLGFFCSPLFSSTRLRQQSSLCSPLPPSVCSDDFEQIGCSTQKPCSIVIARLIGRPEQIKRATENCPERFSVFHVVAAIALFRLHRPSSIDHSVGRIRLIDRSSAKILTLLTAHYAYRSPFSDGSFFARSSLPLEKLPFRTERGCHKVCALDSAAQPRQKRNFSPAQLQHTM